MSHQFSRIVTKLAKFSQKLAWEKMRPMMFWTVPMLARLPSDGSAPLVR